MGRRRCGSSLLTYPREVALPRLRSLVLSPLLLCTAWAALSTPARAAEPITGTVTNRTDGKPSAGDQVVLIQLQQGMQESTRTTTDAHGRFTLPVSDDGIHLVRVTHQKAAYFQPVQPDQHTVAVTVYDAAPNVAGVSTEVEELHIEATPTELHVVEVLQVLNESSPPRTQFGPNGFEFYVPPGALIGRTGAITQGGMPVQTPAVPRSDPGHFSFLFPLRPGETQFGIAYTLPYTGSYTFTPRLGTAVKTFAVILPTAMKVRPGVGAALASQSGKPGTQMLLAQNLPAGQGPEFTVSGTGTMPDASGAAADTAGPNGAGPNASTANPTPNRNASAPAFSNSELAGGRGLNTPLDESGDRDPWAKYKWWILSGLALRLAAAAGFLLRKQPVTPDAAPIEPMQAPGSLGTRVDGEQAAPSHRETMLAVLKEELFLLETERLQGHLSEEEYRRLKGALELVLGRALLRQTGTPASVLTSKKTEESTALSSPSLPQAENAEPIHAGPANDSGRFPGQV